MDRPANVNIINRFLRALPATVFRRVELVLQPVALKHGAIIGYTGALPADLYFLDRGLISLVKVMNDGRTAEVGVIGNEGMTGITTLMGMSEGDSIEMTVQQDAWGYRLPVNALKTEMACSAELRSLATRYLQFTINRMTQSSACNALHRVRQRCCRWLLVAQDNAGARTFESTHEFLAMMMGVHRPRLSIVLKGLERQGIIETHRGSITIIDRLGLEASACECYATIEKDLKSVYRQH